MIVLQDKSKQIQRAEWIASKIRFRLTTILREGKPVLVDKLAEMLSVKEGETGQILILVSQIQRVMEVGRDLESIWSNPSSVKDTQSRVPRIPYRRY